MLMGDNRGRGREMSLASTGIRLGIYNVMTPPGSRLKPGGVSNLTMESKGSVGGQTLEYIGQTVFLFHRSAGEKRVHIDPFPFVLGNISLKIVDF